MLPKIEVQGVMTHGAGTHKGGVLKTGDMDN